MENKNLVLITEFCLHHQVEQSIVVALHEFDLIKIIKVDSNHYLHEEELNKIERFIRLHKDLGINLEGVAAIDVLLEQITMLQQELASTTNRLNFYASFVD